MSGTADNDLKNSPNYNANDADITLISSDGTEFKVHSYMLKAHRRVAPLLSIHLPDLPAGAICSLVLRPILCDPAFKPSPMTIDASAEDLTCFLHLMHIKPPHTVANWEQAGKVLDLIEQYECDIASERMWVSLQKKAETEPWEAFCSASHRDYLDLAKHALKYMQADPQRQIIRLTTLSYEDAADVALPYLLGLVRKLAISSYTEGSEYSYYHNDWTRISQSYEPVYSRKSE